MTAIQRPPQDDVGRLGYQSQGILPAGRSDAAVDNVQLAEYLAGVPEFRDAIPIRSIERIGRGQSNLTFRVTLTNPFRRGRSPTTQAEDSRTTPTVILRRPPTGPLPPKAHDVLREFRVIRGLRQSAVPVPEPILSCADPAVIGAPFFLMEDLPGDAIRFELPPAFAAMPHAPRSIAEQVVDTLAALHTTDPTGVGLADLGRGRSGTTSTGYIERQVRLWKGQLDYARVRPVPDLDWTGDWLERNLPRDVDRPSIVHGDYKLDNVIFSLTTQPETGWPAPRVLGVVDWEMAALGDPLADLGWLLAFWCENGTPPPELTILPRVTELPAFPRRAELADRYAERVGRRRCRSQASALPDLRFYVVLALWKMAVLLEAHWARHVRGTAGSFDFTYLEKGGPILAAYIRRVAIQNV